MEWRPRRKALPLAGSAPVKGAHVAAGTVVAATARPPCLPLAAMPKARPKAPPLAGSAPVEGAHAAAGTTAGPPCLPLAGSAAVPTHHTHVAAGTVVAATAGPPEAPPLAGMPLFRLPHGHHAPIAGSRVVHGIEIPSPIQEQYEDARWACMNTAAGLAAAAARTMPPEERIQQLRQLTLRCAEASMAVGKALDAYLIYRGSSSSSHSTGAASESHSSHPPRSRSPRPFQQATICYAMICYSTACHATICYTYSTACYTHNDLLLNSWSRNDLLHSSLSHNDLLLNHWLCNSLSCKAPASSMTFAEVGGCNSRCPSMAHGQHCSLTSGPTSHQTRSGGGRRKSITRPMQGGHGRAPSLQVCTYRGAAHIHMYARHCSSCFPHVVLFPEHVLLPARHCCFCL